MTKSHAQKPASQTNVLVISADAGQLGDQLERFGYRVTCAADLVGALVTLRSVNYQAILCDGDRDNVRAIVARCPGVPIVVAVPQLTEPLQLEFLAMGAADTVDPSAHDPVVLPSMIERAIARARGQHVSPEWRDTYLRRFALLKDLFAITTDPSLKHGEQIERALHLGCELFGLDIGIVSRVVGDDYRVEYVHATAGQVVRGQRFLLGETICDITLASDVPVGIADLSHSAWREHPCRELGLSAYLGAPLTVNGHLFGTLALAAVPPRSAPWTELDLELVGTLAAWIASALGHVRKAGQLRLLSTHDALTGLENRASFEGRLRHYAARAGDDPGNGFALLFADLSGMGDLNRTYGYAAGDALLVEIGNRLATSVRPNDRTARFDGDRFVVLLERVSEELAHSVARRLATSIAEPFVFDEAPMAAGVKIGIVMSDGWPDAAAMLGAADSALALARDSNSAVGMARPPAAGRR